MTKDEARKYLVDCHKEITEKHAALFVGNNFNRNLQETYEDQLNILVKAIAASISEYNSDEKPLHE